MDRFMTRTLQSHPYLTGDRFTAADVLVGSALQYLRTMLFPDNKVYEEYLARVLARPAFARAQARDSG
jgi:glutathione S-transferase